MAGAGVGSYPCDGDPAAHVRSGKDRGGDAGPGRDVDNGNQRGAACAVRGSGHATTPMRAKVARTTFSVSLVARCRSAIGVANCTKCAQSRRLPSKLAR